MFKVDNHWLPASVSIALIWGAVCLSTPASGAETDLQAKLRGGLADLVRTVGSEERIRISILMQQQVSREMLAPLVKMEDKSLRRSAGMLRLQSLTASSQADLLSTLQGYQTTGEVGERLRSLWIHNVIVAEATPAVIAEIAARADVAYINWNRRVPAEEILLQAAPGSSESDEEFSCGIPIVRAPEVWDGLGITGTGVVVAVLDSGICIEHPDLGGRIWVNEGEIPDNGVDDDGNGFIDDVRGWDFENDDNDPEDELGHGTPVAGVVAGDGTNGIHTGVAPGADDHERQARQHVCRRSRGLGRHRVRRRQRCRRLERQLRMATPPRSASRSIHLAHGRG